VLLEVSSAMQNTAFLSQRMPSRNLLYKPMKIMGEIPILLGPKWAYIGVIKVGFSCRLLQVFRVFFPRLGSRFCLFFWAKT
jgi:hypothetical protein